MEKLSFKLSEFEGPLDLLLFLISKHKLNILNISISLLLEQYMDFINNQENEDLEVKSEFLEMAARLINIKTLMLLPKHEEEANQLREKLTGELMELSLCKQAAGKLLERSLSNQVFVRNPLTLEEGYAYRLTHTKYALRDAILSSKVKLIRKQPANQESFNPLVRKKVVSVESRIIYLLGLFYKDKIIPFKNVFMQNKGKSEIVATFLALLELIKAKRITISPNGEEFKFEENSRAVEINTDFT